MKKQLNRLFALILCLSFVCSLVPAVAETDEASLRFRVENGEATLIGSDFTLSGDVVIPAEYQGYPVTAIGAYAFSDEGNSVKTVTIPHTVTSIHREAFMNWELEAFRVDENNPAYRSDDQGVLYSKDGTVLVRAPLQLSGSYTLPTGVTAIEEYAFHQCFGLTEIHLPEGLTCIGQRAFDSCNKLSTLCLSESIIQIGVYAFSGCSQFSYSTYENAKYLGTAQNPYQALVDIIDKNTTSVQVHPDTKLLAGAAMRNCRDLETVNLPEGLVSLGDWQFPYCSNLAQLKLPGTLRSIGSDCFFGSGLQEITIPEGVVSIGSYAFYECESLTAITFPDSLTSIGEFAFAKTPLSQVTIGKNVAQIGIAAFSNCWNLNGIFVDEANPYYSNDDRGVLCNKDQTALLSVPRSISGSYQVPDTVTYIESYAFHTCYQLTDIQLPEGAISFGEYVFAYCHGIEAFTVPEGCTELSKGLFLSCGNLKTLSLPEGLTVIGEEAIGDCSDLAQLLIPSSVTKIGASAFHGCSTLQTVTIPEGVTALEAAVFSNCSGLIQVSIPNSIRQVGYNAFSKCTNLQYNTAQGIKGRYLGNEENPYLVFMGVSDDEIERLTIHQDTKVLRDSALARFNELRQLTLPEGLLTIGNMSLYDCTSLKELVIPSTVTYIGEEAFARCRFTEIVIPASVEEVGENCFQNCQNLNTIRFCAGIPKIASTAFIDITATAYCHFDGNQDRMKNYGGTLTWAEGHVFLNYLPDEGFSCPTGGTMTAQCEGCEKTDTFAVTEAAQHSFEKGTCSVCGEIDPEACFLCGDLTGTNDSDAVLTLSKDGEAVYTLTVSGNTYFWEALQPGDYTLAAEKENHVTYRTPITVTPGGTTLDITLCRPGDVVGIGTLNIGDVSRIYSHIRGTSPLTGYALACADVNGNGTINMGDIAKLYSNIRGN